jgi:hypothetical protein
MWRNGLTPYEERLFRLGYIGPFEKPKGYVSTPDRIGNTGMAGVTAVEHIVLLQWLPGMLKYDMAVFLVGGGDLEATLAFIRWSLPPIATIR